MNRELARALLSQVRRVVQVDGATREGLTKAAELLAEGCRSVRQAQATFRLARPGEELCYELAIDPESGIALYLVSDGPGSVSPPHEHPTWALVAGGSGIERNRIYRRMTASSRRVVEHRVVDIGSGDTLVLPAESIHSTEAVGTEPTYHLHLYGRALPLGSRTYEVARDA